MNEIIFFPDQSDEKKKMFYRGSQSAIFVRHTYI
jgi:hypothetical protein